MPSRGSCCANPFQRCGCPPGPRGLPGTPAPPPQAGELLKDDPTTFVLLEFITVAFPNISVTVDTIGTLNPASVGFSSPSLGMLRYDGTAPALFSISYAYLLRWATSSLGTPSARFYSALMLNGTAVGRAYWVDRIGLDGDMEAFYGQALLSLSPGDVLSVGVGAEDGIGTIENIEVRTVSLVAK